MEVTVRFQHSSDIWRDFPELVPAVIAVRGISTDVSVDDRVATFGELAAKRLATASEGELPEIQAWRRAFSKMGLKPTQYRCASESLLRRFRKEGALPRLHPLIDLCNAVSMAYAIPVAVFDLSKIAQYVEVRYATGDETYLTFSGETEHPPAGEVIFADAEGRAHARRWTNRQSGSSAIRDTTTDVLIVAEALHETAQEDIESLTATLADELTGLWPFTATTAILSPSAPCFTM
jgi:DNA/RNA-binding domain of Phe-tRNA-synthetase-like protein